MNLTDEEKEFLSIFFSEQVLLPVYAHILYVLLVSSFFDFLPVSSDKALRYISRWLYSVVI